jgi:hypothetical protein
VLPQMDADSSDGGAVRWANDADPWWRRLRQMATQTTLRTIAGGWSAAARELCWVRQREGGSWAVLRGRVGCATRARRWHVIGTRGRPREGGMEGVSGPAAKRGGPGRSPEQGMERVAGAGELAGAGHGAPSASKEPGSRTNGAIAEYLAEGVLRVVD